MKFQTITHSTTHSIDGIWHCIEQTGEVTYRVRTIITGCVIDWSQHRTLSAAMKARDALVAETRERYK
jgi:hypothetical protein